MLLQVAVVTHADGLPILYGRAAISIAGNHCPINCVGTQTGTLEFTIGLDIIYLHRKGERKKKGRRERGGKITDYLCVRGTMDINTKRERENGGHATTGEVNKEPRHQKETHVEVVGF